MAVWNFHAIEQTQLRRKYRVDGVGRPKFDAHTGEAFSHFGGTSAFPECWSAALLEDEAFARVEFLPPPESADVAPVCQYDVAAATVWEGEGLEGIYSAPLSVDADARNAAEAADTTLLAERERDVWLKLDELLRRLSSVSPTAVPVSVEIKFMARSS